MKKFTPFILIVALSLGTTVVYAQVAEDPILPLVVEEVIDTVVAEMLPSVSVSTTTEEVASTTEEVVALEAASEASLTLTTTPDSISTTTVDSTAEPTVSTQETLYPTSEEDCRNPDIRVQFANPGECMRMMRGAI